MFVVGFCGKSYHMCELKLIDPGNLPKIEDLLLSGLGYSDGYGNGVRSGNSGLLVLNSK